MRNKITFSEFSLILCLFIVCCGTVKISHEIDDDRLELFTEGVEYGIVIHDKALKDYIILVDSTHLNVKYIDSVTECIKWNEIGKIQHFADSLINSRK